MFSFITYREYVIKENTVVAYSEPKLFARYK